MIRLNNPRLGELIPRANSMALIITVGPRSMDLGKRTGGIFMAVGSMSLGKMGSGINILEPRRVVLSSCLLFVCSYTDEEMELSLLSHVI
jgi:hypothetical protein